ncbi:MAG: type II secretion system F family protein [archaeon]|jgi:flagellar protein FlaJ
MFEIIAQMFSILVPKKFMEEKVKVALTYAGSKDDARNWIGLRLFIATLMATIGFLIPFSLFPLLNVALNWEIYFPPTIKLALMFVLAIVAFLATSALFYLHISYVIDGRKKMVENILPDFLFLVGNNLKSGMSPFYAFRSAVRPEFGPLSEEIKIATQKSLGVQSFSDALRDIGRRIDSKVLSDTTKFFSQALRSGGHLAQLIETTAADIKQTNQLKKELATSTKMYSMFILFVVIIASPMLLAVSVQFLNVLSGIQVKTSGLTGGGNDELMKQSGLGGGTITITADFMKLIAYFVIFTNSLLASIFIGILGGGKIKDGLKFAPIMIIVGLILFTIFVTAVGGLLGNFSI